MKLDSRARALAAIHIERRATLGVDPKLILVFDLAGPVATSALRAAGLTVLGGTQGSAVVAFADDPQLHAFLERVQSYRVAEADVKYAPNEGFIDVLADIRLYSAQDRLTRRLRERIEADASARLDVQVDLWHPGDRELAEAWIRETAAAVIAAEGDVRDRYVNHRSGLLLIRATCPRSLSQSSLRSTRLR